MRFRFPVALPCLVAFALLPACARAPQIVHWEQDLYFTEKLYVDGQFQLASARFAKLRASAKSPRDADEAAIEECGALSRDLQRSEAMTCYDALAVSAAERPVRMRAVLSAAELRFDPPKDAPDRAQTRRDGLKLLIALVVNAPDTSAGLRAVDFLTLYGQENALQRDEMLALFARLEHAQPTSELADNLLLRGAVLLEAMHDKQADEAAIRLLAKSETAHPDAATALDTLDLHVKLLRRQGRFADEVKVLQRIVETFETSYVFASYVGSVHRDAFARLIELHRGPLLDLGKAEAYARRLPEILHHPLDLPKYLMTVAEIQEQRGNPAGAIATCRSLLEQMQQRADVMVANDRRICDESATAEVRESCRQEIAGFKPIESKDERRARDMITRLQAQLATRGRP